MLENLKKNWFVVVIAVGLLIVTGFYIKDQASSVLRGKTVDGKQVVFEIKGHNYLAEDYQKDLQDASGDAALYTLFERQLLKNIDTSEDIKSEAKLLANNMKTQTASQSGQKGLDELENQLIALGYDSLDDLTEYYENSIKYTDLVKTYFMSHYDELFATYVNEKKPRLVSHILIKFADVKNPTEAELEKIKNVDAALAEGKSFAEVAMAYSEDTESAKASGSIGVVDSSSSLVAEFSKAMLALNKGETSVWIDTQYGRHLIRVDATEFSELLDNSKFLSTQISNNAKAVGTAIWEKAQFLDFKFEEGIELKIKTSLGIAEEAK